MPSVSFFTEMTSRMTLLGVTGLAAAFLLMRHAAEHRHAIWRVVLMGMMALPILMTIAPPLRLLPGRTAILTYEVSQLASVAFALPPSRVTTAPPAGAQNPATTMPPTITNRSATWIEILFPGYVLVAGIM